VYALDTITFKSNGQIIINNETFIRYIAATLVCSELSDVIGHIETVIPVSQPGLPSLQSLSMSAAVGTHFEKDSPGYEMMKGLPMTPLLFPQYLIPGDILYIDEPHGSTIVKVVQVHGGQYATALEIRNADDIAHQDLTYRRRYKQFQLELHMIVYDLGIERFEEDRIDNGHFIDDISNVFIIHKERPPAPPP
jgi:hypothetical protein